jgi:hypothetical protein
MSVRKSTRRINSLRSSGPDVATMMATFARCSFMAMISYSSAAALRHDGQVWQQLQSG